MKRMFWRLSSNENEEIEDDPPPTDEVRSPRRRTMMILTLALSGAIAGFLASYALPSRYQAQSTVLVEAQKLSSEYVHPIIVAGFAERVQSLEERVKSPSLLRPMLQGVGFVNPEEQNKLIGNIQQSMQVEPVITSMSAAVDASPTAKKETTDEPLPGFNVVYSDTEAARAQKICNAMTALIVDENLRSRSEIAQTLTDFLSRQVDDARKALDEQAVRLIMSKTHSPRAPGEEVEYKLLALDYDNAETLFKDLLAKKNAAALGASMENQEEGEQMHIAATAGLPEDPTFPDRPFLAFSGLCAGVLLGIGRLLWPAARKACHRIDLLFPSTP
jgi:uncharacterized protein involved in exopolysaccharide biosynthesis